MEETLLCIKEMLASLHDWIQDDGGDVPADLKYDAKIFASILHALRARFLSQLSLMEDAAIDITKAEKLHPNGDIGMIYSLVARWVGLLLERHALVLLSEILALDTDVISQH
jgi:hypothetical protein